MAFLSHDSQLALAVESSDTVGIYTPFTAPEELWFWIYITS